MIVPNVPAKSLFLICEGNVNLVYKEESFTLKELDIFGNKKKVETGVKGLSVESTTDLTLLELDIKSILLFFKVHKSSAQNVWQVMVETLGNYEIGKGTSRLHNYDTKTDSFLKKFDQTFDEIIHNPDTLDLLQLKEIFQLNHHTQTLYSVVSKLIEEKILEKSKN